MGLWDNIKNIMTIPEEDEYDEDEVDTGAEDYDDEDYEPIPTKKEKPEPRIIRPRAVRTQSSQNGQMQVVLVKPNSFGDVTEIADHLNAGRTVVLNLEEANRDVSRRIVDFLSGVAYANSGTMKKVAKNTFIIVARGIDVAGELMLDDIDESKLYF